MDKRPSLGVLVFGAILIANPLMSYVVQTINIKLGLSPSTVLEYQMFNTPATIFFLYIFPIILGIGILNLEKWARRIVMYLSLANIFFSIQSIALFCPLSLVVLLNNLFIIFLSILFYYFFTRPAVKEQFK